MSIATLVRNMAAAGAPPEAIALAVEAIEAAQADVEERKAVARERKRRQRDRARDMGVTVTGQSQDESVTVTSDTPSPAPSPPSPPDPPIHPAPTHTPARDTQAGKGSRLPGEFEPQLTGKTAEMVKLWPPGRLEREVAQFRDHYAKTGGDKGLSRDWQASLRTWLRNADDRIPRDDHRPRNGFDRFSDRPSPTLAAAAAQLSRMG